MQTGKVISKDLGAPDVKAATLVTCGNCWNDIAVETIARDEELAEFLTTNGWNAVTTTHEFIPNCCPSCVSSLLVEHSPH